MKRPAITAIASSGTDVVFSWSPPSSTARILSYTVDYSVNNGGKTRIDEVLGSSYRIRNADEGVYTVWISAKTARTQSAPSLPVRLHHVNPVVVVDDEEETPPETAPAAPTPAPAPDRKSVV